MKRVIAVAVLIAIVVGSGGYAYAQTRDSGPSYRTGTAQTADVQHTLDLSGTVSGTGRRDLSFGTAGSVRSVAVKAGQHVRKGQVLARLDPTSSRRPGDLGCGQPGQGAGAAGHRQGRAGLHRQHRLDRQHHQEGHDPYEAVDLHAREQPQPGNRIRDRLRQALHRPGAPAGARRAGQGAAGGHRGAVRRLLGDRRRQGCAGGPGRGVPAGLGFG